MEKLTVNELLERCARRPSEDAAWDEFVRRYHSTIRNSVEETLNRQVREEDSGGKRFSEELKDDLVMGVYMRLVEEGSRALKNLEGTQENSIFEYLSTTSVEVALDYLREANGPKVPKRTYSLDELLQNNHILAVGREARNPRARHRR